ncbi:hypothetical protein JCM5350_003660, partial [Sporobolomyces pararoseus]
MEVEDLMNLEGDTIMLEPSISTTTTSTTQASTSESTSNTTNEGGVTTNGSRSTSSEPKPFLTSYKTNKLLSEKALGKQPEPPTSTFSIPPTITTTTTTTTRKIPKLNLTKSARLALNDTLSPALVSSTSSTASTSTTPFSPLLPSSSFLSFPDPSSTTKPLSPILPSPLTSSSSLLPEEQDFFLAPSGRSLRARGVRPSYLEIPPSSITSLLSNNNDHSFLPPIASTSTSLDSNSLDSREEKTASELLQVSGRLVKRFKKWDKQRKKGVNGKNRIDDSNVSSEEEEQEENENENGVGGGKVRVEKIKNDKKRRRKNSSTSGSSELSSIDESGNNKRNHSSKKKNKNKRSKTSTTTSRYEGGDRDSSPLSSISSSPNHSRSSSIASSSSPRSSSSPEPASPDNTSLLPFPNKPKNHPLNKSFKYKPSKPPPPPNLEIFKQYQSDLNQFSWIEGLREITLGGEIVKPTYYDEEEQDNEDQSLDTQQEKKKPSWEWAEEIVTTAQEQPQGSSLAHPPPATNSTSPSKSTKSFLSVPITSTSLPLNKPISAIIPTISSSSRPKTYRQIARLDWSDFHQRHKCRFTTSGSIEGVNPESLDWEVWFGIEDEFVSTLRRGGESKDQIEDSLRKKYNKSGLIVFTPSGLKGLNGKGSRKDFEETCWKDESFEGGFEWNNLWRFKTLQEGMGRSWESKCRWAVRNPERKYLSDSSSEDEKEEEKGLFETEQEIRERLEGERRKRKIERKKAKRERIRKEREGSGGESELTPLEGEELSTDSDETEEEVVLATMSAAAIARKSSLMMQQAADAHAASGKAGVMV